MEESGIGDRENPLGWWNTFEVNIFGVYNFVRPALKHLEKSKGHAIVVSTRTAQLRLPNASDYGEYIESYSLISRADLIFPRCEQARAWPTGRVRRIR